MTVREITNHLEKLAPLSTQESYDNSGLIVGSGNEEVTNVLVSLDCTEDIVEEARSKQCELIIAHHPIIFGGLKKLNGKNYVERTVIKAIKYGIAIYAIHTNLDNYIKGVNFEIGNRLGLTNLKVLRPKSNVLNKLVFFVPSENKLAVLDALYASGAGRIGNYGECSFSTKGEGTFKPLEGANPYEGEVGKREYVNEERVEVLVPSHLKGQVYSVLNETHPYEEVAHEFYPLENQDQYLGSGMVGSLGSAVPTREFLQRLKETFNCGVVRHTNILSETIRTVAFCGGSGSFLLKDALRANADIYITGDFKYHEFFDAEGKIIIADIGHYESEQFTSDRIKAILMEKFSTFAVHLTEVNTNPINYF
ncbi:MAG: Nif3-like dinuclear metal center hexameric protein [Crocinitomicaceae bacterium]